jgi:hypothetical protein
MVTFEIVKISLNLKLSFINSKITERINVREKSIKEFIKSGRDDKYISEIQFSAITNIISRISIAMKNE